jgi:mono/diheme cytochrome c family protein
LTQFLLVSALLVGAAAAVLGQQLAGDAGDEARERGRAHVEKTCAACHPGSQLEVLVRRRVGDEDPAAALDAFLAGHHVPDEGLRAAVIAYLRTRITDAPS